MLRVLCQFDSDSARQEYHLHVTEKPEVQRGERLAQRWSVRKWHGWRCPWARLTPEPAPPPQTCPARPHCACRAACGEEKCPVVTSLLSWHPGLPPVSPPELSPRSALMPCVLGLLISLPGKPPLLTCPTHAYRCPFKSQRQCCHFLGSLPPLPVPLPGLCVLGTCLQADEADRGIVIACVTASPGSQ